MDELEGLWEDFPELLEHCPTPNEGLAPYVEILRPAFDGLNALDVRLGDVKIKYGELRLHLLPDYGSRDVRDLAWGIIEDAEEKARDV